TGANLSIANLSGTNLTGADLSGTDLTEADLSGTDLSRADLNNANLRGANLSRADLTGANIGETIFGNIDLRATRGLETVTHDAPSTIGTDTLLRSEGDIPETFLRQAGLSDTFITYVRSLAQNPREYYTCFISYSSQDQEFAERLYTDLQRKDIRCWFAPEDLKIGDEFRRRIDESIRIYDKLLVILSQHSIDSSWVEYEVKKALKKEQDQGKPALFPIALDEAIKDAPDAWAAAIRRKRHIGDFTKWKDHDAYQVAFGRLLRDLQPSTIPPMRQP
ncbi:MAG TPA: toll/interleukin-1 receptor domain-containing protein, partial [Ktedonobacteraceae bacterium]|nr:toll/interleukin-1 receptor domain-containing protein [Ktedonobacteraceae bacterium]